MSKLPPRGEPKAVAAGFWQLLNSPSTSCEHRRRIHFIVPNKVPP